MKRFFVALCFLSVFFSSSSFAQNPITPQEAASYVGQKATICGTVASATYAGRVKGRPTFLNLGVSYPHQIFTAVIWGRDRGQFNEAPETAYRGKEICVTGLVELYKGKPEIIVRSPGQVVPK